MDALEKAVNTRDARGVGAQLNMISTRHLRWDSRNRLQSQPMEIEQNNILFHDRNNRFVEKQMSDMAKNALRHNMASELLKQQYNLLRTAIRGKF